jgi:hypothetical protein
MNTRGYSPYVTSSLKRGWVCRLQLLLGLASAVILRSESRGTHDHILLSQIRDSPSLEGQVPVFISPRNGLARLYPQTLGSLFVASYDSQGCDGGIRPHLHTGLPELSLHLRILQVKVKVMLRPTVSRPVCLGTKHQFGAYDKIFINCVTVRSCSCGAPSLTRGRVCLLYVLLALASAVFLGSESLGT